MDTRMERNEAELGEKEARLQARLEGIDSMFGRIMDRLGDFAGAEHRGPRRNSPKTVAGEPAPKKTRLATGPEPAPESENDEMETDASGAEDEERQETKNKPKEKQNTAQKKGARMAKKVGRPKGLRAKSVRP